MTQLVKISLPPPRILDKCAEIERLAALLQSHAQGTNQDRAERKQFVHAALDFKIGKCGQLTRDEAALWERTFRPIFDGIMRSNRQDPRIITAETPLSEMSIAEFKRYRPDQALRLPEEMPAEWRIENWTEAGLLQTKAAGLRAILLLNGLGTSGIKKQRVDRLLLHRELLNRYGSQSVEQLAALKGRELEYVLKALGVGNYGNKRTKAITILNAFLRRKNEGESRLAGMNYRRLTKGFRPVYQLQIDLSHSEARS